jgi:hypothetical protein
MDALQEAQEQVREQLEAAWQIHVAQVEDRLQSGWRDHIAKVFEDRFAEFADRVGAELETRVADRLQGETANAVAAAERAARGRLADTLADAARRLQDSREEAAILAVLLETARRFALAAAVFVISGSRVRFVTAAGGDGTGPLAEIEMPLAAAPAVAEASSSRECVTAVRGPGQLSPAATSHFDAAPSDKVTLLPVAHGRRVAAVLCVAGAGAEVDLAALEVLAALGGAALITAEAPAGLATLEPPVPQREPAPRPAMDSEEQEVHLRARRVARVQVAEIRLYQSDEVKRGRSAGDLYAALKPQIDTRREAYRKEFIEGGRLDTDYFHTELVHTLANDDETLLGKEYPGPLL